MAASIAGVYNNDLKEAINAAKVLVVGAGGIGCELLKNLVLSGFKDIEIVDLDTIDVSNLNRQFLFQKQHVGQSKASVARESALRFNPESSIKAYQDNIRSADYGLNFFKRFDIVMNALDNRAARNHVNRLCLAADVPLIESGTAGYYGQVELIKKGLTQCYECEIKAPQKTYPGCTIRNTPSEPIHCIVWSKHLFNQLFGEADADEEVSPDSADPANKTNEVGNIERKSTREWAQECDYDAEKLFNKLFHDDIKYLLLMKDLWANRKPPIPATFTDLPDEVAGSSTAVAAGMREQQLWSIAHCASVFSSCCASLRDKLRGLTGDDAFLVWDKDDNDAMDFVAACANIRSHVFGIEQKSRFDIKSMAGNIIPAIATSNAIIAGLVVLHAFKVLEKRFDHCQSIYLRDKTNVLRQQIIPEKALNPPKANCTVCSSQPKVLVALDVDLMTVKEFEEKVLKKALHMIAPDVILDSTNIVISSEEGETEENNDKSLRDMKIVDGSLLTVDDYVQSYVLLIVISHVKHEKDAPEYVIEAEELAKPSEDQPGTSGAANGDEDDDLEMVEVDSVIAEGGGDAKKRKKDDEEMTPPKKRKINGNSFQEVENVDDEDDIIMVN